GTYIGRKKTDSGFTYQLAVKVKVKDKVSALSRIDSSALIPPVIRVGGKEITNDVESGGDIVAQMGFRERLAPPITPGSSLGHPNGETGTFGCLVVLDDGKLCILSNNHVIAALNAGPANVNTLHPGLADAAGNKPAHTLVFGQLVRFAPLNSSSTT